MQLENINEIASLIGLSVVNENRRYWLVRAKGGRFFDEFYFENFIAIGWNIISKDDLPSGSDNLEEIKNQLKEIIQRKNDQDKKPGYPAGQIVRFVYEMKKDDIVLVPNKDSNYVAFGQLVDDEIYQADIADAIHKEKVFEDVEDVEDNDTSIIDESCPFIKRRSVRWLKTINSDRLDPYLYRILHSHNAISEADKYANYIDRSLYDLYIKNNIVHMTLEVKEKRNIPAPQLLSSLNNILSGVDLLNNELETDFNKNEIDLKLNVQSPGPVEFIFNNPWAGIALGMLIVGIVGAKFKFEFTKKKQAGSLESEGLIGRVLQFLQQKHDNNMELKKFEKELKEAKEALKLRFPDELDNN